MAAKSDRNARAFAAGRRAAEEGRPASDKPDESSRLEGRAWLAGHQSVEDDAKKSGGGTCKQGETAANTGCSPAKSIQKNFANPSRLDIQQRLDTLKQTGLPEAEALFILEQLFNISKIVVTPTGTITQFERVRPVMEKSLKGETKGGPGSGPQPGGGAGRSKEQDVENRYPGAIEALHENPEGPHAEFHHVGGVLFAERRGQWLKYENNRWVNAKHPFQKSTGSKNMKTKAKALPGEEHKDAVDDQVQAADVETEGEPTDEGETEEPFAAQVLRRIHQDHLILMAEYDKFMDHFEGMEGSPKDHLQSVLEGLETTLTDTEETFEKEFSHLEALEGSEETKDMKTEEEEPEGETETATSEPEEEVPAEEAVEGMKKKALEMKKYPHRRGNSKKDLGIEGSHDPGHEAEDEEMEKALKMYRAYKSMQCSGGKNCKCAKCAKSLNGKQKSTEHEGTRDLGIEGSHKPGFEEFHEEGKKKGLESEQTDSGEEFSTEVADDEVDVQHPGLKSLEDHEKKKVGEAAHFLKDLSEKDQLGKEDIMQSYHFHKSLGDMAQPPEMEKLDENADVQEGEGYSPSGNLDPAKSLKGKRKSNETEGTRDLGIEGSHKPGFEEFHEAGKKKSVGDEPHTDMGIEGEHEPREEALREEQSKSLHPHRQACKDASMYFKELTEIRPDEFNNDHRVKALFHHKALDPIAKQDDRVEVQEGDATPVPPGEMGEKKLVVNRLKKDFVGQQKAIQDLALKMNGVLARI